MKKFFGNNLVGRFPYVSHTRRNLHSYLQEEIENLLILPGVWLYITSFYVTIVMHLRSYSSGRTTKFLTWTWTWSRSSVGVHLSLSNVDVPWSSYSIFEDFSSFFHLLTFLQIDGYLAALVYNISYYDSMAAVGHHERFPIVSTDCFRDMAQESRQLWGE